MDTLQSDIQAARRAIEGISALFQEGVVNPRIPTSDPPKQRIEVYRALEAGLALMQKLYFPPAAPDEEGFKLPRGFARHGAELNRVRDICNGIVNRIQKYKDPQPEIEDLSLASDGMTTTSSSSSSSSTSSPWLGSSFTDYSTTPITTNTTTTALNATTTNNNNPYYQQPTKGLSTDSVNSLMQDLEDQAICLHSRFILSHICRDPFIATGSTHLIKASRAQQPANLVVTCQDDPTTRARKRILDTYTKVCARYELWDLWHFSAIAAEDTLVDVALTGWAEFRTRMNPRDYQLAADKMDRKLCRDKYRVGRNTYCYVCRGLRWDKTKDDAVSHLFNDLKPWFCPVCDMDFTFAYEEKVFFSHIARHTILLPPDHKVYQSLVPFMEILGVKSELSTYMEFRGALRECCRRILFYDPITGTVLPNRDEQPQPRPRRATSSQSQHTHHTHDSHHKEVSAATATVNKRESSSATTSPCGHATDTTCSLENTCVMDSTCASSCDEDDCYSDDDDNDDDDVDEHDPVCGIFRMYIYNDVGLSVNESVKGVVVDGGVGGVQASNITDVQRRTSQVGPLSRKRDREDEVVEWDTSQGCSPKKKPKTEVC